VENLAQSSPDEIREMRKNLKMTQQNFADELGVHRNNGRNWESGKTRPLPTVIKLMQIIINCGARKVQK
jgi:DNA-binding transcriptional regulator YiaG